MRKTVSWSEIGDLRVAAVPGTPALSLDCLLNLAAVLRHDTRHAVPSPDGVCGSFHVDHLPFPDNSHMNIAGAEWRVGRMPSRIRC